MFMGFYLFDLISKGWDRSFNKVFKVVFNNVCLIRGLDGWLVVVVDLFGILNSFVEILNNGKLCILNVIFMFVWIKFKGGCFGFIINYNRGFVWEIYLWVIVFKMLFVCYVKEGGIVIFLLFKVKLR